MRHCLQTPSPHHDARAAGAKPVFIMLHYTGTRTAGEAADVYLGRAESSAGRVSPHYMIDRNGQITQFVDESRRAWHAGLSFWRGCQDLNSVSIGIELVNEGELAGYPPYAEVQMLALIDLCLEIRQRHAMAPGHVLGHSDVAPMRRCDPGPALDWARLAQAGIGLWPTPEAQDQERASTLVLRMVEALRDYGYDPHADAAVVLRAFQSRFYPQALTHPGPRDDLETAARLCWLVRHNPP